MSQKRFWVRKDFGTNKILGQKYFGSKLSVKIKFGSEKKMLSPKKKIGFKNFLRRIKIWGKKSFASLRFWSEKSLVQKNLDQKRFEIRNELWGPKYLGLKNNILSSKFGVQKNHG